MKMFDVLKSANAGFKVRVEPAQDTAESGFHYVYHGIICDFWFSVLDFGGRDVTRQVFAAVAWRAGSALATA